MRDTPVSNIKKHIFFLKNHRQVLSLDSSCCRQARRHDPSLLHNEDEAHIIISYLQRTAAPLEGIGRSHSAPWVPSQHFPWFLHEELIWILLPQVSRQTQKTVWRLRLRTARLNTAIKSANIQGNKVLANTKNFWRTYNIIRILLESGYLYYWLP